jgi:hypothetical protein
VLVTDEHLGAFRVKDGKLIRGPISLTKKGTTQHIFSSGGDAVAQLLLDSETYYPEIGLRWIKNGKPGDTKTFPGVKIERILPTSDGRVIAYGIVANPNNPSKLVKWIRADGNETTVKIDQKGHEQSHLKSIQSLSGGTVFLHLTDPWARDLLIWLKDGKEIARFEGPSLDVSTAEPDVVVAIDNEGMLRWFKDGQLTHSIQVNKDTRYSTPIASFPDGTVVVGLSAPSRVVWYRDGVEVGKINKTAHEIHALPNGQTEILLGTYPYTDMLISKPSQFSVELPKPKFQPKNR